MQDRGRFCVLGKTQNRPLSYSGTGYFDMVAYEKFHEGEMSDYIPTDDELASYREKLPKVD